jgi:hypothetical protein
MNIFHKLTKIHSVVSTGLPRKTMQIEAGFVFTDPNTDFTWKISQPWVNRWHKRQIGWICKKVGPHPEQCSVSNWYEHEIINLLKQAEITQSLPV